MASALKPEPGTRGTPVRTELMPNGMRRHTLADGRVVEEDGPWFRLEYQSVFPGETYFRDISIFGLAKEKHLFEAWSHAHNAMHTYAFSKVHSLEEIATGDKVTGEQLRELMGGE